MTWYFGLKSKVRIWLWVIMTLFFGITAVLIWRMASSHQQTPAGFAIPVEVTSIRRGTYIRSIQAAGTLHAYQAVIMRPEVTGRITNILYTDGHPVQKDDLLVSLDDSIPKATLEAAMAKLALSESESKRSDSLYKKQATSLNERDTAFAKHQVDKSEVDQAKAHLAKMSIKAPFAGVIGVTQVHIGDFVNPGQPMVDLVQLDPIFVDFHIPEIYLNDIYLNQNIEISSPIFKDKTSEGIVTAINPKIDPIAHSIYMRGQLSNADRTLRPGLFVTVNIILGRHENTLFIPDEAIISQQDKQFVYCVEDNKAVLTEVVLGERNNNEVVVLKGLKPSDVVVSAGQIKLQPGAPVHPINQEALSPPKQEMLATEKSDVLQDKPVTPIANKDAKPDNEVAPTQKDTSPNTQSQSLKKESSQ